MRKYYRSLRRNSSRSQRRIFQKKYSGEFPKVLLESFRESRKKNLEESLEKNSEKICRGVLETIEYYKGGFKEVF